MSSVTRKTEIAPIDGTPVKRMFWSIISDYDLKTALCELVDNALDPWMVGGRRTALRIEVLLDADRQLISVIDDAGGVRLADLHYLLAPGGSKNDPGSELIGVFGVGSKRAGVALGEQVEIKTRFGKEQSHQIDITKDWLNSSDWELAAYAIPDIAPGTTEVHVSQLRKQFTQSDALEIRKHLEETYAWFLKQGASVKLNGTPLRPRQFDKWAYPPGFVPRAASFESEVGEYKIALNITAGLIRDRVPELGNYGVYFYCNHRLIVKELQTREVGYFVSSEAGVPHPDASLCRVIVDMQGPAHPMPWTSSKSGINFDHPVFQHARPTLIQLTSYFSSLSRRLKDDWEGKVFEYGKGTIEPVEPVDPGIRKKLVLPSLPRLHKPVMETLKAQNKAKLDRLPWTLGLLEALGAVDIISRQKLQTKNRISLILLDSNFEIALKEFIVHRADLFPVTTYNDAKIAQLFARRHLVITEVAGKISLPKTLLDKAKHYYDMRNKLIHERATVTVTDTDIATYRLTIQRILKRLFGLKFSSE